MMACGNLKGAQRRENLNARITRIYATRKAKEHMQQKHQVDWKEVEEAMAENPPLQRTYPSKTGERRYVAFGRTAAGRRLVIILAREDAHTLRVVTAHEPRGKKQRRRARRRERR